jgi:hypothetical protein
MNKCCLFVIIKPYRERNYIWINYVWTYADISGIGKVLVK